MDKYTVQLDEEAVKEIKDQVFRDFRDRWAIINKENIELKREIHELREKLAKSHEETKQAADIIFYFLKRFGSTIDDIATFEITSTFLHDLRVKYK